RARGQVQNLRRACNRRISRENRCVSRHVRLSHIWAIPEPSSGPLGRANSGSIDRQAPGWIHARVGRRIAAVDDQQAEASLVHERALLLEALTLLVQRQAETEAALTNEL